MCATTADTTNVQNPYGSVRPNGPHDIDANQMNRTPRRLHVKQHAEYTPPLTVTAGLPEASVGKQSHIPLRQGLIVQ